MQTYANHAKFVPLYHFVAFPILVANLVWSAYRAYASPEPYTIFLVFVAAALVLVTFFARVFALRVQDRVIRLEMRMRLAALLPAGQQARILALTPQQMVGLRFASDAELPALVTRVIDERIADAGTIKKMVKTWVPDEDRA